MANKTTGPTLHECEPALKELGITKCPICRREVTVYLTRTRRPFLNCSVCGGRIFYNGSEAIRLLQMKLKATTVERTR